VLAGLKPAEKYEEVERPPDLLAGWKEELQSMALVEHSRQGLFVVRSSRQDAIVSLL